MKTFERIISEAKRMFQEENEAVKDFKNSQSDDSNCLELSNAIIKGAVCRI